MKITCRAKFCTAPLVALALCLAATSAAPKSARQPRPQVTAVPPGSAAAPPASATGGFDGARAYQYVADMVAIGPRTAGTEGSHRTQQYITSKLQSFGCPVEPETFRTGTPIGSVQMTNLLVKLPGAKPSAGILLFATHYDTKREVPQLPYFVGAIDGGSSTGVMLEFARLVCKRKNAMNVWIVFLDGEEAFNFDWADPDNTYGSRELAARLALSGDLPKVKAFILADMVGSRTLHFDRESTSTPWLTDLIWSTAARLGYRGVFVNDSLAVDDDHDAFLKRHVPSTDIIDFDVRRDVPYWHTPGDTLDKVSAISLAIVGHVLIESLPALEHRFGAS